MRLTLFTSLFPTTTALVVPFEKRQSSTACGDNYYSAIQVSNAANQAYTDWEDYDSPSEYPHTYNNYEGFSFPVEGPYLEFPILESGIYAGGSPGADRVVITEDGEYAGAITHTGASGDDFVGCSGTF